MRHVWLTRILKFGIPGLLFIVLLSGMAFSGTTTSGQVSPPALTPGSQMVFGQVVSTAADKNSFVIQSDGQTQITVSVNQRTSYVLFTVPKTSITAIIDLLKFLVGVGAMPSDKEIASVFLNLSLLSRDGKFSDIAVGDIVSVSELTSSPASRVNILKYQDIGKVQGSINTVSADSLTITPPNGSAVTIGWDVNTRVLLNGLMVVQAGQTATAIYDVQSNSAIIIAISAPAAAPALTPASSPG